MCEIRQSLPEADREKARARRERGRRGGFRWRAWRSLVAEQDEVGTAANVELGEQIGDVELHGALGDIEAAGDFLVGEIFK